MPLWPGSSSTGRARSWLREFTGKPEDLIKVKGVGEKLFERLKDQITVGEQKPVSKGRGG